MTKIDSFLFSWWAGKWSDPAPKPASSAGRADSDAILHDQPVKDTNSSESLTSRDADGTQDSDKGEQEKAGNNDINTNVRVVIPWVEKGCVL